MRIDAGHVLMILHGCSIFMRIDAGPVPMIVHECSISVHGCSISVHGCSTGVLRNQGHARAVSVTRRGTYIYSMAVLLIALARAWCMAHGAWFRFTIVRP